jgi:hypothetical protein
MIELQIDCNPTAGHVCYTPCADAPVKERTRVEREKLHRSTIIEESPQLRAAETKSSTSTASEQEVPVVESSPTNGHNLSSFSLVSEQAGTGRPLTTETQQKFGPPLGLNLDPVRIHTEPTSSRLAESADARAVTIGKHIHFGAGEYSPGSKSGDELMAHELVHVAQQTHAKPASAPLRESSSALEKEADTLTPQVMRGMPVRTSAAPTLAAAAKPKYSLAHDLQTEAQAAEEYDKETHLDDSKAVWQETLTASTVKDHQAAEAEIKKIKAAEPELLEAIGTPFYKGMEPPSKDTLADNKKAELEMGKFLMEAGMQSSSMGNFQQQYARLGMDMDRIDAMTVALGLTGAGGKDFAEGALKSQNLTAKDKSKMSADTDNPDATASGPLATKKAEVRQWKELMAKSATELAPAEQDMTAQQYLYQAKVDDIAAGLTPRNAPQAVEDLNVLKAKLEKIKGYAKMATGFATKALGGYLGTAAGAVVSQTLGGTDVDLISKQAEKAGEAAKEKVADAAPDLANDFIAYLTTLPFESDLLTAEAKAAAALEEQTWHAKEQKFKELKSINADMRAAMTRFFNAAVNLERQKAMVRRTMEEVGRVADKSGGGHGDKWETLATFLAESEVYLAQSTATIAMGQNEMQQAETTGATRTEIVGVDGVHWWSVRQEKRVASDSMKWVKEKHLINLPTGVGSASGAVGANEVIRQDLARLATHRKFIQEFRDRIAAEFQGLKD